MRNCCSALNKMYFTYINARIHIRLEFSLYFFFKRNVILFPFVIKQLLCLVKSFLSHCKPINKYIYVMSTQTLAPVEFYTNDAHFFITTPAVTVQFWVHDSLMYVFRNNWDKSTTNRGPPLWMYNKNKKNRYPSIPKRINLTVIYFLISFASIRLQNSYQNRTNYGDINPTLKSITRLSQCKLIGLFTFQQSFVFCACIISEIVFLRSIKHDTLR